MTRFELQQEQQQHLLNYKSSDINYSCNVV